MRIKVGLEAKGVLDRGEGVFECSKCGEGGRRSWAYQHKCKKRKKELMEEGQTRESGHEDIDAWADCGGDDSPQLVENSDGEENNGSMSDESDGSLEEDIDLANYNHHGGNDNLPEGSNRSSGGHDNEREASSNGDDSSFTFNSSDYQQRWDEPLFEGAKMSLGQVCFLLLDINQQSGIRDLGFKMIVRALQEIILPDDNILPPSWYLIKKMFSVAHASKYEDISRREPPKTFLPRKSWHFGVRNVIKNDFFSNPTWCENLNLGASENELLNSEYIREIRSHGFPEDLSARNDVLFRTLGADGVQIFNTKRHSTTVLGVRCLNLPHSHSQRYFGVLTIIEGPDEPKVPHPYLEKIGKDFYRHRPGGEPIKVRPTYEDEDGRMVIGEERNVFVVLCGVEGDTPIRNWMVGNLGHSGIMGCGFCFWESCQDVVTRGGRTFFSGGRAYYGYVEKVFNSKLHALIDYNTEKNQTGEDFEAKFVDDQSAMVTMDDPRLKYSGQEILDQHFVAEQPGANATEVGAKYVCPLVKICDWLDHRDMQFIAWGHSFLYGPVQGFLRFLFKPPAHLLAFAPTAEALREIKARGKNIVSSSAINRPYVDVIKGYSTYTMEEVQSLIECYSPYLFHGNVLPPQTKSAWSDLRAFGLWLLRREGEEDDAFGHLAAFSSFCERMDKLGETLGGGKMCTFKLHILNCRAKEQHCRSGHPSFSLEYWVERMVQLVKKSVKYRTTAHPELIFVNTHLVRHAMTRARIHHPDCKSFDELLPNFRFKTLSGPGVDTPSEGDDSLLLGKGEPPSRAQLDEWGQAIGNHLRSVHNVASINSTTLTDRAAINVYKLAKVDYFTDHLTSTLYKKNRDLKRSDEFFLVFYDTERGRVPYVGLADMFVKVEVRRRDRDNEIFRLALSTLWNVQEKESFYRVANIGRPSYRRVVVDLSLIDRKLTLVKQPRDDSNISVGECFFLCHYKMS